MPGPAPKHPSTRARRNASATRATLSKPAKASAPKLPDHPGYVDPETGLRRKVLWHKMTRQWWNDVWASPMSPEWDDSDIHNVYICALLIDDMWSASTTNDRAKAAAEYRLQRKDLGLTPLDRRRLEWQIEVTDEAQDKGTQRRARKQPAAPSPAAGGKKDPRAALSVVS